jgi:hypothetical protein
MQAIKSPSYPNGTHWKVHSYNFSIFCKLEALVLQDGKHQIAEFPCVTTGALQQCVEYEGNVSCVHIMATYRYSMMGVV